MLGSLLKSESQKHDFLILHVNEKSVEFMGTFEFN